MTTQNNKLEEWQPTEWVLELLADMNMTANQVKFINQQRLEQNERNCQ